MNQDQPDALAFALYGDGRGTARPFVAGLAALTSMRAERGEDGVWFVPFCESVDGEEGAGSIDRRGTTYRWTSYDELPP